MKKRQSGERFVVATCFVCLKAKSHVKNILLSFFLLTSFSVTNAQKPLKKQVQNYHILYRFATPDPWGDDFWKWDNQDDSYWIPARNTNELLTAIANKKPKEVFIRLIVNHTPQSLNNFYFRIRHSGPFEVFVNGQKALSSDNISETPNDYMITQRRPEKLGKNIYAIHFKTINPNNVFFDIEIKQSPWINTDVGQYKPNPVLPDLMRDAEICKGKDGYYMTATTGSDTFLLPGAKSWLTNPGIQVFKSSDLKNWKSLGYVWTFEKDGTWNKEYGKFGDRGPARGIFAPEIKYHDKKYWINYSVNNATDKRFFGIGLLYADKPEGPYTEVSPSRPLTDGFDSNIFIDTNGVPYLLKHGGLIARMKPDFTGIEEPFRHLGAANYPIVGYEGVDLFKYKGKYYLTSAEWNVHSDGAISYDSMIASSDSIYGPYGDRYCAIRYGGHNGYFEGTDHDIYATVWCYPDGDYHWQRVSIVKIKLNPAGRFEIVPGDVQLKIEK